MNQRDATCNTLIAVLEDRGVVYELNGPTSINSILTTEDKKNVRAILSAMFLSGQIDFKNPEALTDDKYLKDYVSGLVNNWIRKAPEFNGNAKYEAKNPGSRSSDEMIKELKKVLMIVTTDEDRAAVQAAIDARQAEIKPVASVTIDTSKLPEYLRHLVK